MNFPSIFTQEKHFLALNFPTIFLQKMYFWALNFTTIFIQKYFWALNFPSIFIQEKYFGALNSSFSDHSHDGLLRTGEEVGLYICSDLFATCSGLVCDNYWYRLVGTKWCDSQSRFFFAESLKHPFLTNRTRDKQSTAVCIVFSFYYSIIGDVSLPQFPFKTSMTRQSTSTIGGSWWWWWVDA